MNVLNIEHFDIVLMSFNSFDVFDYWFDQYCLLEKLTVGVIAMVVIYGTVIPCMPPGVRIIHCYPISIENGF